VTITPIDIALGAMALLAGMGIAMFLVLQRRKAVAFRKRCFDVSMLAKEEGLDLLTELLESIATGDLVEMTQEISQMLRMFKTPGALAAHLDKLFAKQLELRLKHVTDRIPIFDAVDAIRAAEAANIAKIVSTAETAKKVAAIS
jgi:hypothetical protein